MVAYIDNIEKDEMRSGFLVTTSRKKVWQIELELLVELDRICKKYDIAYFVDYGTLLGAVRHQGFIPWDDDIDIAMMRPDYERFKKVVQAELTRPLFFQSVYTDDIGLLMGKIMHLETSGIHDFSKDYSQGIFIDIWPLDAAPEDNGRNSHLRKVYQELIATFNNPRKLLAYLEQDVYQPIMSKSVLQTLCKMPMRESFYEVEMFLNRHFYDSESVEFFTYTSTKKFSSSLRKDFYAEAIMMPFEGLQVPVPCGWQKILDIRYGNWHEFVQGGSEHEGAVFSADVPYKTMLREKRRYEKYDCR